VGELLEAEPNLRLKTLTDSENGRTPYVFGIWAINYLMVESGPDVFLNTFYPAIQELGWEKAFSQAFGISIDQFYTDFDQFSFSSLQELTVGRPRGIVQPKTEKIRDCLWIQSPS
jgi:hypothetical protein